MAKRLRITNRGADCVLSSTTQSSPLFKAPHTIGLFYSLASMFAIALVDFQDAMALSLDAATAKAA